MDFVCLFQGCSSTKEQIEDMKTAAGAEFDGFAHYEDHGLRVCENCKYIPLAEQKEASGLDQIFMKSLQEELRTLENSKEDLGSVFRFYNRYARELISLLQETVTDSYFFEIPPILEFVEDLVLFERVTRQKGGYSAAIEEIFASLMATGWKKGDERLRKKIARILRNWKDLKVFSSLEPFTDAEHRIRALNISAQLLDRSAQEADESDEEACQIVLVQNGTTNTDESKKPPGPAMKRIKTEKKSKPTTSPKEVLDRILKAGSDPFEVLGIEESKASSQDVRKQYRKLCLFIHPDKNPDMDADKCQDALLRVQRAREEAELRLEAPTTKRRGGLAENSTMCYSSEVGTLCRLEGCLEAPCRQCANSCCVRNITHCHQLQARPGGKKCFFHPPARLHARNA